MRRFDYAKQARSTNCTYALSESTPETRLSLLAKLGGSTDEAAWVEFVQLYTPAVFRTARYLGLQPEDAEDVTQQVLMSVAKALSQRPHDPSKARFRTWLSTVTRNATLDALRKRRPDRGSGDSQIGERLHLLEAEQEEDLLEQEYQKELFRWAARQIQSEFETATWRAFWLTTVEGREIAQVAEELGKKAGSVYAARSRVIRRLRAFIEEHQGKD